MNKYKVVFDMFKNKILFIFKRCEYNNNKILISKNFSFLSIILSIIIIRFFKFIIKNESDKNNFNINSLKDILNRKRSTFTFKTLKKMIKKFNFINIIEIDALAYYYLIYNKKNKLFF